MENENTSFQFLNSERARKYFADSDIALKQGRHLQDFGSDSRLYSFVDEFYERGLKEYYFQFFQMNLIKESNDNSSFYYLDFFEEGKGKFGKENRSKELEDEKVIFGILLLNMFKDKFFENKEVLWEEMVQIFRESEQKELWQILLYGRVKPNYTPTEEQQVKDKVKTILKDFEKLGWVLLKDTDDLKFEILPSIARIGNLYSDVINNIEVIEEYLNNDRLS